MKLSLRFIFVIILITWCQPASTFIALSTIAAVGSIVSSTISISLSMRNLIAGSVRYFGSQNDRRTGRKYYMSEEQNDIIDHFIDLGRQNSINFEAITSMLLETAQATELANFGQILGDFFDKTTFIDLHYNDVVKYADRFLEFTPEYLSNATLHLISTGKIKELIRDVRLKLLGNPFRNILQLFVQHGKEFLHKTGASQSPQQYLNQLLNHTITTELKAFLTISYCYQILENVGGDKAFSTAPMDLLQREFADNLNKTVAMFQEYMLHNSFAISTEFYRINPLEHIKDVTYTELERVFQKRSIRQDNLYTLGSIFDLFRFCSGKCTQYTKVERTSPCRTKECRHRTCEGTIYDCQQVIDTDAEICLAANDSIRMYDYILYGNGRRYGQNVNCSRKLLTARAILWCNQCLCTCADETTRSDRFICTKEQSTNTTAKYVLTGVRMRKINHILYLQNQEGILLPNIEIRENSTRWIPIKTCPENHIRELSRDIRQLTLGQVKLPSENQILTGISFAILNTSNGSRITVKGTSTIFNISTGELANDTNSTSEHLPPEVNEKSELDLNERSLPTRFESRYNFVKTDHEKFVKFQTSGMDDDAGQSTIPFLDIQDVAPYPPVPLSGVGVYHKAATPSDGGYVGLSVFSYDISNLLRPDLPSDFNIANIENFKAPKNKSFID